jgi:hypothetical protein
MGETTTAPCGPRAWIGRPSDISGSSFVGIRTWWVDKSCATPSGSGGCRSTLSVAQGMPLEVIRFLYERLPRALRERDEPDRSTLLHHLGPTSEGFPIRVETLEFLVEHWPESLQQRNSMGELPFHVAVANRNLSAEAVRFLFEQHPPSIRERDGSGFLPLHWDGPV